MAFKKISSPTLKELFIKEIETMILTGELAIGEKLPPEREIAQKMQISRSVVNDGIVEMAKKGFLTIIPRQGTYVADYEKNGTIDVLVSIMKYGNMNNDYIRSTLEIRHLFMDFALESAIDNMTEEKLELLRKNCLEFKNTTSASKAAELMYEFDYYLVTSSDNVLLPLLFSSFKVPNIMLFERHFTHHGFTKTYEKNVILLQYIETKNIKKAKEIMQQAILEALDSEPKTSFHS